MNQENREVDRRRARERIVPERGTVSGSGGGMSDEEALAILRKAESTPTRENPDIEVVVGASEPPGQIKIPLTKAAVGPMRISNISDAFQKKALHEAMAPPRVVISKLELHSSIRSVLDRARALRVAEEALGKGESLRMRVLLDKSTFDFDLSKEGSDDLEASVSDLIDRYLD